MLDARTTSNESTWRRATCAILLGIFVWQAIWLVIAYLFTGGHEFGDDLPSYRAYVDDPTMLLTDRHRSQFGAAVAPPLLPFELKIFHSMFASAGDFLAFRITMLLHALFAMTVGFVVAFREFKAPDSWQGWIHAALIAIVPVSWVSVLTGQDDTFAAAWSGVWLAACIWLGPVVGAVAAGAGMFFGKIFIALAFLALWIVTPNRRWSIALVGSTFVGALFAFLLWRDGDFLYSDYVYAPYMGASVYGVVWLVAGEFDLYAARDLSALLTGLVLLGFTWVASRRRLSLPTTVTALHMLFLTTYFGAMPDYYAWFLPFLVVTLWSCYRQRHWATLAVGWSSTFFAYGYKVLYGLNSRFQHNKPGRMAWIENHIHIDIEPFQIAIGIAAVVCTVLFAGLLLLHDPTKRPQPIEASISRLPPG
jgi:hypothetical protein